MALAAGGLTVGVDPAFAQPTPGASQSSGHPRSGTDQHRPGASSNSPGTKGSHDGQPGTGKRRGGHRSVPVHGPVLAATDQAGHAPSNHGLQQTMGTTLQDKSLGTLNFAVADAATGEFLFGSGESVPAVPASTTKLATSVAALSLLPADFRIATKVVQGAKPGEITLVGGGDPTLTALPADQIRIGGAPVDAASAPASMADLAERTAAALKAAGVTSVKLGYDTSLYSGPLLHKEHDATNIAAVTPLMVDEGRIDPKSPDEAPARVFDPAGQAADSFARFLTAQGITVQGKPAQATAAADAAVLGQVESPTIERLVERLLTMSDNTLAEAVARQAAIAAKQPASFDGGVKAVTDALTKLGVPMTGVVLNDGSGLNKANLIPPITLVKLLAQASSPDHPELRPVITGLPIAAFTGTLVNRYGAKSGAAEGAGIVRAKTGTLAGVITLAGTVVDSDGRVLAFAMMTRTTAGPDAARAAVDRIVARIIACGCQ
ncbi:D-alanyl-D-alanine carboxypeptidase/D-alanyl-D-alanine-endopeptidase [Kitasatospora sp. NPDC048365]|uniref:D-alanyl-D-alanine carboxypeptidase/D-alanyl-D-alanine endopeptidase n=1 Tax=Kitasatospora sp. NPDC048365 TaxID=3364050 RepID=UPI003718E963